MAKKPPKKGKNKCHKLPQISFNMMGCFKFYTSMFWISPNLAKYTCELSTIEQHHEIENIDSMMLRFFATSFFFILNFFVLFLHMLCWIANLDLQFSIVMNWMIHFISNCWTLFQLLLLFLQLSSKGRSNVHYMIWSHLIYRKKLEVKGIDRNFF
jgi:hypothetical protein